MFGLCITPNIFPTQQEHQQLNVPYYRSILYKLADLEALQTFNKPLVITLNNQCAEIGGDWSGWDNAVLQIAKRLGSQCLLLECGNEFDLYWHENKQDVPPEFAASLAIRAARICHQFGIKVAPTSVAGAEWPEYIEHLIRLCGNDVDYFGIHGYGKKPVGWRDGQQWFFGQLSDMISHVQNLSGKQVVMTEYGVKIRDAGSSKEVANFLRAANNMLVDMPIKCWFAYHDLVGAPSERGLNAFGLKSEDGTYREAWDVMVEINKGQSNSLDPLEKWKKTVGPGLLNMMRQDNTEPVMSSEWRPFDRPVGTPATIEQCIAKNGNTYFWILPEDRGYVIRGELRA